MARISAKDFVGTRARFQRLSDAKIFNGWVDQFYGNTVIVTTSADAPVELGDEFRVEGFGNQISVVFNAKLSSADGVTSLLHAAAAVDGSSARMLEPLKSTLKMVVTSPVRYSASQESVRYQVEGMFTGIAVNGEVISAFTVDVAPNGIGAVCKTEIEPGSATTIAIQTGLGPVKAEAVVRYCRAEKDREGYFRIGLMFTNMGRIERPRWERFVRELA